MAAEHTPYLNLLRKRYADDDEQLRLAAAKVQQTLSSEGWGILKGLLEEAHTASARNLILGQAAIQRPVPSQAEFARATGFLAGVEQPQVAADAFDVALEAMRRKNESPE